MSTENPGPADEARLDKSEDRLDGLEKKVDKMDGKLDQVRVDTAKLQETVSSHEKRDRELKEEISKVHAGLSEYNAQLKEHIRRTEQNEEAIQHLKMYTDPVVQDYNSRQAIAEYKKKKFYRNLKIIGAIVAVVGTVATLVRAFSG